MGAEELLPTAISAALFLAVHKLGRPPPGEGKGKIASRELYTMPVECNIEGQEGQQVACVGNALLGG